jgi:hypothetical protein
MTTDSPAEPDTDISANGADLHTAMERLRAFGMSWNPGDIIDDDSGLTADDLRVIVAHRQATEGWMPPLG